MLPVDFSIQNLYCLLYVHARIAFLIGSAYDLINIDRFYAKLWTPAASTVYIIHLL